MRTLSATMLAAQQSASARPYLRVRLFDREVGTVRLRWQRWYSGSEPDGPCAAAVPADGSLLRARIDPADGALTHQRIAAPSESSDFTSWTSLGTVAATSRLGLAAAGTRALAASVRTDGVSVEVRESTDSGTLSAAPRWWRARAGRSRRQAARLQSDGSAAVLYAVGGTIYAVTRSGTGAWSAPVAWTLSLASVSGVAASFQTDYSVLVSGATSAGEEGAWATMLGSGGLAPPGSWSALTAVVTAAPGTNVTYLATGAARADVPRATFVESYSGGGAYDRVHGADGVALSLWGDFLWREPRPLDRASAHGLAVVAGVGAAWLCSPDGVWRSATSVTETDLTATCWRATWSRPWTAGGCGWCCATTTAATTPARPPRRCSPAANCWWRRGTRRLPALNRRTARSSGSPRCVAVAPARLRRWRWRRSTGGACCAPGRLLASSPGRRARRARSSCCATSRATSGSRCSPPARAARRRRSSGLHGACRRAGAPAVSRLVGALPDVLLMKGLNATLTEPAAGDAVDYAYGVGHAVFELRVQDTSPAVGWARVFGNGVFAEAVDEPALRDGAGAAIAVDDNLTVQARADARAATLLRQAVLAPPRAELVASPNVGLEVADVIRGDRRRAGAGGGALPRGGAAAALRARRGAPALRDDACADGGCDGAGARHAAGLRRRRLHGDGALRPARSRRW